MGCGEVKVCRRSCGQSHVFMAAESLQTRLSRKGSCALVGELGRGRLCSVFEDLAALIGFNAIHYLETIPLKIATLLSKKYS